MDRRKTLTEPDPTNPLAERTLGRRLWAAYLRAGFTRAEFARELGLRYATVIGWDNGATPDVSTLARAAQVVGYTLDELYYGHRRPALKRRALIKRASNR